jgi:D-alanyl-D-alanine carboxypeptidase (penicillin-binding protein 5/6)
MAAGPAGADQHDAAAILRFAPLRLVAQGAFILDDTTGRALYAYNADTLRYPASTVKMMTAIVVLQHLNLNAVVTVPAGALVGGTTANLWAGEQMRVRDLLYGMLLPSGNDAAMTLADAVAGSPGAFAGLMNAQARRLHLWHTHFLTPNGFDVAGQYTTARDLAWLAHALLRRHLLAGVVRTRVYDATAAYGGYQYVWTNLNHLLWTYPGAIGVKTGTTPLAGANLVACAVRGRHRLIAVVMGSTVAARFDDATSLLDYGWRLLGSSAR